jgi:hypothetical protein
MSDTHAIDHRAVLIPLKVKVVAPPVWDNTHIDREVRWIHDNAAPLARYWHDLADGQKTEASGADFNLWLRCRYEIEVILQARARLPHGAGQL